MRKLFPCKKNSDTILIYCSVVPHDFPPSHRLNFVRELSKNLQVIFIDLPSGLRLSSLSQIFVFYGFLARTFYRFDSSFLWEFFQFRKLNFYVLYLYLLFQKFFFGKKVILYTTSGYSDPIYSYIPFDKSIFDCPDIHKGEFEKHKAWIRQFDLVFTNTKLISEIIKKYNNNVKLVSSGYLDKKIVPVFSPQKIPNSVAFFGGISQRIDYNLLKRVIRNLPNVTFYFIGDVYLNKYYVENKDGKLLNKWNKILTFSNVNYLGNFSNEIFHSILPFFRIGIVPYVSKDTFNFYSNPIKLYDYLSSGMYVVSTPIPNVTSFTKSFPVYIAQSPDQFVRKIKFLLRTSDKGILKYKNKVAGILGKQSVETKVASVFEEINLILMDKK